MQRNRNKQAKEELENGKSTKINGFLESGRSCRPDLGQRYRDRCLLSVEARVVIASVETYLKYAEAIGLTANAATPA
jgi:hypothetical protein